MDLQLFLKLYNIGMLFPFWLFLFFFLCLKEFTGFYNIEDSTFS